MIINHSSILFKQDKNTYTYNQFGNVLVIDKVLGCFSERGYATKPTGVDYAQMRFRYDEELTVESMAKAFGEGKTFHPLNRSVMDGSWFRAKGKRKDKILHSNVILLDYDHIDCGGLSFEEAVINPIKEAGRKIHRPDIVYETYSSEGNGKYSFRAVYVCRQSFCQPDLYKWYVEKLHRELESVIWTKSLTLDKNAANPYQLFNGTDKKVYLMTEPHKHRHINTFKRYFKSDAYKSIVDRLSDERKEREMREKYKTSTKVVWDLVEQAKTQYDQCIVWLNEEENSVTADTYKIYMRKKMEQIRVLVRDRVFQENGYVCRPIRSSNDLFRQDVHPILSEETMYVEKSLPKMKMGNGRTRNVAVRDGNKRRKFLESTSTLDNALLTLYNIKCDEMNKGHKFNEETKGLVMLYNFLYVLVNHIDIRNKKGGMLSADEVFHPFEGAMMKFVGMRDEQTKSKIEKILRENARYTFNTKEYKLNNAFFTRHTTDEYRGVNEAVRGNVDKFGILHTFFSRCYRERGRLNNLVPEEYNPKAYTYDLCERIECENVTNTLAFFKGYDRKEETIRTFDDMWSFFRREDYDDLISEKNDTLLVMQTERQSRITIRGEREPYKHITSLKNLRQLAKHCSTVEEFRERMHDRGVTKVVLDYIRITRSIDVTFNTEVMEYNLNETENLTDGRSLMGDKVEGRWDFSRSEETATGLVIMDCQAELGDLLHSVYNQNSLRYANTVMQLNIPDTRYGFEQDLAGAIGNGVRGLTLLCAFAVSIEYYKLPMFFNMVLRTLDKLNSDTYGDNYLWNAYNVKRLEEMGYIDEGDVKEGEALFGQVSRTNMNNVSLYFSWLVQKVLKHFLEKITDEYGLSTFDEMRVQKKVSGGSYVETILNNTSEKIEECSQMSLAEAFGYTRSLMNFLMMFKDEETKNQERRATLHKLNNLLRDDMKTLWSVRKIRTSMERQVEWADEILRMSSFVDQQSTAMCQLNYERDKETGAYIPLDGSLYTSRMENMVLYSNEVSDGIRMTRTRLLEMIEGVDVYEKMGGEEKLPVLRNALTKCAKDGESKMDVLVKGYEHTFTLMKMIFLSLVSGGDMIMTNYKMCMRDAWDEYMGRKFIKDNEEYILDLVREYNTRYNVKYGKDRFDEKGVQKNDRIRELISEYVKRVGEELFWGIYRNVLEKNLLIQGINAFSREGRSVLPCDVLSYVGNDTLVRGIKKNIRTIAFKDKDGVKEDEDKLTMSRLSVLFGNGKKELRNRRSEKLVKLLENMFTSKAFLDFINEESNIFFEEERKNIESNILNIETSIKHKPLSSYAYCDNLTNEEIENSYKVWRVALKRNDRNNFLLKNITADASILSERRLDLFEAYKFKEEIKVGRGVFNMFGRYDRGESARLGTLRLIRETERSYGEILKEILTDDVDHRHEVISVENIKVLTAREGYEYPTDISRGTNACDFGICFVPSVCKVMERIREVMETIHSKIHPYKVMSFGDFERGFTTLIFKEWIRRGETDKIDRLKTFQIYKSVFADTRMTDLNELGGGGLYFDPFYDSKWFTLPKEEDQTYNERYEKVLGIFEFIFNRYKELKKKGEEDPYIIGPAYNTEIPTELLKSYRNLRMRPGRSETLLLESVSPSGSTAYSSIFYMLSSRHNVCATKSEERECISRMFDGIDSDLLSVLKRMRPKEEGSKR